MTPLLLGLIVIVSKQYNFLLFHTLVELFTVTVAILMSVVVWQTYPFTRNNFLMYLGCCYFWIGSLDIAHTLIYKGMQIFPYDIANPSVQFWLSARYMEAALLLSAPLFLTRRLNRIKAFVIFGISATLLFFLIMTGHFPDGFVEGQGLTAFKINSEYIIICVLGLSMFYLSRQKKHIEPHVLQLMYASIVLTMCAELAFTFYVNVYGLSNIVGHVFKLFSYWLIFIAIIRTTLAEPFSVMAREATTYDAIPAATIVVDEANIIRQANKQACLITGKSKDELVGQSSHQYFHPQSVSTYECPICQSVTAFKPIEMLELERPEQNKWFDYTLSAISIDKEKL
ncbi:MAG: MASE3 domain-containing protein, partial [Gammaproteobacteria bacterium]|nr:MASE3 domain-containing protein [Gammaproteobacteria bacterium]